MKRANIGKVQMHDVTKEIGKKFADAQLFSSYSGLKKSLKLIKPINLSEVNIHWGVSDNISISTQFIFMFLLLLLAPCVHNFSFHS